MLITAISLVAVLACGPVTGAQNNGPRTDPTTLAAAALSPNRVEINYFFIYETGTCTCFTLARGWTTDTMVADYQGKVDSGKLVYRMWNSEDPANAELVKEFNAKQNALFVTVVKDGARTTREVRNLWLYLDTSGLNDTYKNKFIGILKKEIDKALEEI
jgi:hypothetical protein